MSDSTVRYSRLPSQGIVSGLDQGGFLTLIVVTLIAGVGVIRDGALGLLLTLPVTGPLVFVGLVKRHGQSLSVHLMREVVGLVRTATGGTKYRARPERRKKLPVSALDLPGMPGRLHLYETGSGAVVVWDAVKGTGTVSCMIATPGMGVPQHGAPSTVSEEQRAGLIWEWAKVLGSFTQKSHVQRVCVLEHTRPGTIAAERRYFEDRVGPSTAAELTDSYREALELAGQAVVMHVTMLSITFTMTAEAKQLAKGAGGGVAGMLALAELEMSTVQDALSHAGFTRVAWMSAREWGSWGKSIIDPGMQAAVDTRIGTEWGGVDPQAALPMLIDDRRTHVETDSAWHRAFWIQEWPRYDTHPGFLSRLVFAQQESGAPVRHTFALVASPIQVGDAMKRLDEEKRTWITNANLRAKAGKPHSAADDADWAAIAQHEADLVAGQGELRFSAYLVVTATSRDALERESASMLNAAAATGLEPRLIPWQQWEAVATVAYPAGLGMK